MTVKELINELSKYPEDMKVYDYAWLEIERVKKEWWTGSGNYPYDDTPEYRIMLE